MAWLSPCKYGRRCLQSGLDSTASCYKCVESGEIKRQSVGGHNECFKNYVSVEKLKLPFSTDEIFLCKECVISVAVDNNAISVLTKEMELHNTSEYIHPKVVVSDQSYTSDDKQPAVGQSDSHTLSERGISAIPIPNKFTNANSSRCGVQPDQTILKSGFNATVTTKSLDVLKDGGQIDDETINFFCGMVTDRVTDTKIQMCSTFLVPKFMASTNMEEKQKCMKKYCKIENPDSMLVPFYVRNHWTIGYINFQTKKIEHYDHCFGIYRPDNFQPIAILVEMCDTLHILTQDWDISEKTEEEINKQEGTTDCGIHVCMDVLHLLQTDKSFQVRNCSIDTFRTRMCKEIAEWEESIPSEVKSVGKLSLFCHQNSDLRSLPNIGNTCHFTVACWSFCSHLTLESVQKHLVDYDNDRNSVRNSLLKILVHLMTGAGPESSESNIYDTNLRQNIGRVLLDMYPLEPNGQHDAGETFNKLMGILNLPGLKLRKKVTCDMHSQSTMYQKSEEYSSMNLYMPQGNLKNILFQDLVDQQQNASNPKWRCPNNNTGDCKSSSIQFITGPPAPVLTFVIVRNLPDNYLSTTNVEVPRIFNVVVHNPAQEEELEVEPKYDRQEVSYRVDSVVVHTFNSEQENGADQDQEYSILNPGYGHYMVCKHRRTTSSKDEFLLCDDLKYPDLYPVEDDYIFQNGKNIVLVTAVLVSESYLPLECDSPQSVEKTSIHVVENRIFRNLQNLSLFCHQNSDLRSLPNIGNTCHFTVACWSFCSHLTLESVQKHLVDYDNDRNSVRNSLLKILVHLMTGAGPESSESNIYDTNLRQNIGRVLLDMYPLEPNGQHDAGETFNKLMGILNLPGLKLRKKVTCDMHSQSTMYQKSEEYSSMNLYMPQGNLKNILFQDLVDQQQNASNPKWRCPNNNTGDCKSSSIQFITGPPAPVLTFVIVRNLPDNYLSTTNVEVPRIFNVVVHNPAQEEELEVEPKYDRQEVSYRVDSVVVHTFNSEQENGADQDQEYSILNPGYGHYMVCKHRRTTSSKDEFLLCDDLKYPDLYPVEDDYIFQNGKNIVLVTAVLVSKVEFHTDTDSEDVPTSEIESDFEDSEKKSSKIISSSTGIKLNRKTTDDMQELKVVTDSEVQPVDNGNPTKRSDADTVRRDLKITLLKSFEVNVTSLIHLESEVLFRQFTHFFQNNVDKIRTIPGLITESSSYEQRMDELKTNPLQFIHCFGIHALRNLWNLQQIAIYKLVTDTLIELVVQDPTNKVRDSSTRALLRTCINIGNSCSCVSGSSPCEYVYNPLYPADLFLNGIQDFKSFSNQGNWDPMYYTELFCSSDNTMFLVGPSVDPTTFICPSRFLAAVILQEIIFNNYFKIQDGHLLSKREVSGNSFESISLKFPENMVPFDLQELRNTWKSLESEASKLTRAASSTTVVETDVSTVWKIFTTIMSVLPVKGRSSMGFVDLTNGRRGALLANMMLGTPCIGVERNREVFNESVKLIKQAANIKKNLKIFMVNANYSTIKDFEGILGCCMYIGNGSLYLSSDYSETIPRIFAAKSMMFYYDCKTTTKIFFQKVTDTEVQKKWYMTIIRQCKQESNQHNVFLWMKKMKYWENNLVNPSENVKHWLEQAESGAVSSSATVEKDSTSSLAVSNSMSPSILGKTLFFSPERPRRLSHPKPNIDQLVESQPSKIRKPNFLIKRSKKIKIAKSSTTKRSKDNNEHFKSNSISLPEPTKKIILPKIQDEGKKTSASGSISIPVSTEKSVQEKNFSNFDVQKLEKYVDSAFEKHLNFGALQQILTGQIEKIENAVLKKLTEDAKKQTENLVLKKIDESTITNQINIRTSVEEMKQYVKKSEHKKGEQFFKAAFETVTSIATSNLNHSVKSPHSPTRNSHSHDRRKRHRQSRSDSECSRSNSERRRPPTSKKHKRKKNKYSSSESTSPRKNHRSETRGRGRSRSRSASNSRNRSQRRFRSSTNDSRSSYHSAGSPSLRRDVQVDVGAWSLLEVCQFLSSKNFPISVRDAFKSAQIHGRLLKEINEEYVNNVIRVQNGLELFNSNQVPSIVEVIHEICRSGRK